MLILALEVDKLESQRDDYEQLLLCIIATLNDSGNQHFWNEQFKKIIKDWTDQWDNIAYDKPEDSDLYSRYLKAIKGAG